MYNLVTVLQAFDDYLDEVDDFDILE